MGGSRPPEPAHEPAEPIAERTARVATIAATDQHRPAPTKGQTVGRSAPFSDRWSTAFPWSGLLFVGWLTVILAAYYGLHKPPFAALVPAWPADLAVSPAALLQTLGGIAWAIWIGLAAAGAGWWLLQRIWPVDRNGSAGPAEPAGRHEPAGPAGPAGRPGPARASPIDRPSGLAGSSELAAAPGRPVGLIAVATSFALGLGAIGLSMLLLGFAGGYQAPWLAGLLLGFTLLGLAGLPWRILRPRRAVRKRRLGPPRSVTTAGRFGILPGFLWAGFLVVTLGLAGLSALGPPIEWDALTYHLAAPRAFLAAERLVPLPGPHFAFPALLDLVFTLGLGLGGEVTARLIGWGCALVLAIALAGVTGFWFPKANRWSAPALFFSAPSIALLAGWAYADLALALFALLAGHFAAVYRQTGARPALVLVGLLAGLALGLKYTAAAVVIAGAGIVLLRRDRRRWRAVAGVVALAALVAAPWYLKNWLWYGNPIYPILFGGAEWDAWRSALFARPGSGFWAEPWRLLVAPFEMTLLGAEGAWGYQASLGPLFLALAPALAHLRRDPAAWLVACFAAGLYVLWLVGLAYSQLFQQSRLLIPALATLAVLLAAGLGRLASWDRPGLRASRVVGWGVLIALALSVTTQLAAFRALHPIGVAIGAEPRDEYLERTLGPYYRVTRIANSLPGADRDLLPLYEPRSYYLDRAIRPDVALDNWGWAVERYGRADAIASAFRASGVRYVLLNQAGLVFLTETPHRDVGPRELAVWREFQQNEVEVVHGEPLVLLGPADDPQVDRRGDPYVLYRLRDPS